MLTRELKELLLSRLGIVDVICKYVQLKRVGQNWLGLCPFHDEKSPSFTISEGKEIFKCFGCGASGDLIDFVMKDKRLDFGDACRTIATEFGIEYSAELSVVPVKISAKKTSTKKENPTIKNVKFIPKETLIKSLQAYSVNNLYTYLCDKIGADKVNKLFILDYYVGTSKDGSAVYWQVDYYNRIRTAQKIVYKDDGHRNKDIKPKRLFLTDHGYSPCFFGEHLLNGCDPNAIICLLESEKSALVCSAYLPTINGKPVIYIASSGINGITEEKLAVLKGKEVCLMPDYSFVSRATWGLLPMRKKQVDGKLKIHPDGDLDLEFESVYRKLLKEGVKPFFMDAYPEKTDGSDIADVLLNLEYSKPAVLQPDFNDLIINESF